MGELMRRYWQPVLASRNVTARPREVRILGEDLIVFRDGEGRPGLLYPRCMHRGTSLIWGHVEADGIRCCYHGWKFAVDGQCIEQPCEPNPRQCRPEHRQPWYPVAERYGLVWAYMGPPERMPAMPRFDAMEPLEEGEDYLAFDNSLGSHGDINGPEVVPYSWLHMNDNVMDPFHVQVLHTTFSGTQFVREFEVMPKCEFEEIAGGVIYRAHRDLADGRHQERVSTWMMPNIMFVPDVAMRAGRPNGIGISVPVDDTHSRILMAMRTPRSPDGKRPMRGLEAENFKPWHERTLEERQDQPGDYEAQAGQGPVSLHSEEHLVTSDKGIGLQRRMLRRALEMVAAGGDPPGLSFDEGTVTHVPSGNFYSG
ncbi:Rieske 2Fe-2S domain-containing protein [Bradyrhizobium sp.]|uniref:Rieske 2Fe-2S domain-containing protein n=1 Tax=Bradyrhizobium sp. TaxID=376 RepID=UPI0025BA975C|nr:Rieske 2Fe-2S domain-containing protein [Bradyrhizobium sp.]